MQGTKEISKTQNRKGSMTEGSPAKCLLSFAIPIIVGNIFQQLYNIVDSVIVGNVVGPDALAAVGASTAITQLFVMVALGTGIGCSVVISQYFGADRIEEMKSSITTALSSIIVLSLALSLIGRLGSSWILARMGTPKNVFADAVDYLNIYFYGFFFLFLYNAFSAIFNALGDSKKPLCFLIISSFLNIGLDLLFVKNFGWGVAGAAWATLIAQAVSAVLSGCVLIVKLKKMKSNPFVFYQFSLLVRMSKVAIPTVLQQSMVSIGMLLIQAVVNRFGSIFMAGLTAAVKIDGMAIVPMVNAGNATSTFVAQNMGAKKDKRVKEGYHVGLAMAIGIGLLLGVILYFFGNQAVGLFMDTEKDAHAAEAIAIGVEYIGIVSVFYFVMGAMNVTNSVLRGSGDVKWFMATTLVNLVVRVSLTYALADVTNGRIIMWANPIGWAAAFLFAYLRYRQGGWRKVDLLK